MSHAGRKPINRELLHGYAEQWACLLYSLRDGCPGFMMPGGTRRADASQKVRPGLPPKGREVLPTEKPKPEETIPLTATIVKIPEKAIITFPPGRDRKRIEQSLQTMMQNAENTFHYIYVPSVQSDPEIWNRLKGAKKAEQVEEFFAKARQWALGVHTPFLMMTFSKVSPVQDDPKSAAYARTTAKKCLRERTVAPWPFLPFLISSDWPRQILEAKRLWTYPRTDRPKSDDKRIEFFARSFAAITLGKSPATATARWLAGWHWPKDWYAGSIGGDRTKISMELVK